MFSAWGALVYRHRRLVALASVLVALVSFPLAGQAQGALSSGGWLVGGSESAAVSDRVASEFDTGRSSLIVLARAEGGDAASAAVQRRVASSFAALRADPRVRGVVGYRETGDERFISFDGSATYAVVLLEATDEESIDQVEHLRELIAPQPGLTYELTGYGPLARDANEQSEADLRKAELVSLPLALLILVLVFGSLLAAGLPILVAGLAVPSTLALIFLVAQRTEMTIYVTSVATMLGSRWRSTTRCSWSAVSARSCAAAAKSVRRSRSRSARRARRSPFRASPWRSGCSGCSFSPRRRSHRSASRARSSCSALSSTG